MFSLISLGIISSRVAPLVALRVLVWKNIHYWFVISKHYSFLIGVFFYYYTVSNGKSKRVCKFISSVKAVFI